MQRDCRLRQHFILPREARAQVFTQLSSASAGEQAGTLRVLTAVGDTLLRLPSVLRASNSAPAGSGVEKFPCLQNAVQELSADNQAVIDTLRAHGALLASIDIRQLQFDGLINEAVRPPAEQALLEAERYSASTVMQTQVLIISTAVLLMLMMITGLWII